MYINENGLVIIDDKYICDFISKNASTDFLEMCESVIKNICLACGQNLKKENNQDELISKLNMFKTEFIEAIVNKKPDLSEIKNHINELKIETNDTVKTILSLNDGIKDKIDLSNNRILDELRNKLNIGDAIKSIEIIKNKIDSDSKSDENNLLSNKIAVIQHTLESIQTKMDQKKIIKNTNRYKGEKGENDMLIILENILTHRDGYTLINTKSIPHNCDINVKRNGFPDIRLEIKAHGIETKEPVRTCETKRFESDITGLNNHGIFISLFSKICGKASVEIDLLPNKKFAIYISNNNYDGETIKDYINLIYKLDNIISSFSSKDNFKLSADSVASIKKHLNDFNNKINTLKTNMKSSIILLNEMSIENIEKLLSGSISNNNNECDLCKRFFSTPKGLLNHKRYCKNS